MKKSDAMKSYVKILSNKDPNWNNNKIDTNDQPKTQNSSNKLNFGPTLSMPQREEE
jgi:hypothetical protein